MSAHYRWVRDFHVKYWALNFALFLGFSYYCANLVWIVPYSALGSYPNSAGKMINMQAGGTLVWLSCTCFTHLIYANWTTDWNYLQIAYYVFTYLQTPAVLAFVHIFVQTDPMWQAMGELIVDFKFWATFVVTMALMILPYIVHKQVIYLIQFAEFNVS